MAGGAGGIGFELGSGDMNGSSSYASPTSRGTLAFCIGRDRIGTPMGG
jgi:hypothetical protein